MDENKMFEEVMVKNFPKLMKLTKTTDTRRTENTSKNECQKNIQTYSINRNAYTHAQIYASENQR